MNKKTIGTVILCFSIFLFFFILKFPFENLKGHLFQTIYKQTRIVLLAESLRPALLGWPGVSLKGVDVSIPLQKQRMNIQAKHLVARAGIGGIFPPSPSFSLSFEELREGGDVYVKLKQGKRTYDVVFEADGLNLAQLEFPGLSAPVQGELNSDSDIFVNLGDLNKSNGDVELNIRKLVVPSQNLQPFMVLPVIQMGTFDAKLNVKNGVAKFQQFKFGDPKSDLRGSITGQILLGKTFIDSSLDIALHIQISDTLKNNPNAASLVSLLNGYTTKEPNSYAMMWDATFREMTTNTFAALPKRLNE